MTEDALQTLWRVVVTKAPKWATGFYVRNDGIVYGARTNEKKFPANFIPFSALAASVEEQPVAIRLADLGSRHYGVSHRVHGEMEGDSLRTRPPIRAADSREGDC